MRRKLQITMMMLGLWACVTVPAWAYHHHHLKSHNSAHLSAPQELSALHLSTGALNCLANAVYREARGAQPSNQVDVARTILARTVTKGFANTACGVVQQKTVTRTGTHCQFTWVCHRQSEHHFEPAAYQASIVAAQKAMAIHDQQGPFEATYFTCAHHFDHHHYSLVKRVGAFIYLKPRKNKT